MDDTSTTLLKPQASHLLQRRNVLIGTTTDKQQDTLKNDANSSTQAKQNLLR